MTTLRLFLAALAAFLVCGVAIGQPRPGAGTGTGVTDGDKGHITVSGTGATWTIDASGMAAVAANASLTGAFESATSNDIDPDRLAGDTTDDDTLDAAAIGTLDDSNVPDSITLNGADAKNLEDSPTALGNMGATESITLLNDDTFTGTLDGNTEITLVTTSMDTGAHYRKKLRLTQDGTGGRVPTWAGVTLSETPLVNPRANAQSDIILDLSYNGSAWVAVAYFDRPLTVQFSVVAPNDLADAVRDACLVWHNDTGRSMYVTGWAFWAGTDNTTLNIETTTNTGATNATVDAVEIATDGTGLFYASDTTITAGTITSGSLIFLDFDDTDTPTWVKGTLTLWP